MGAIAAERIKFFSTRGHWWGLAIFAVAGVGVAALQGGSAGPYDTLVPGDAIVGLVWIGIPVLSALAALSVTNEYGTGMVRTTFQAVPDRALVVVAKAAVAAAWALVIAAVTAEVSLLLAHSLAPPSGPDLLNPLSTSSLRAVGAVSVYAALCTVLAVAVGVLLRNGAGAISVILLWPTVIETVLGWTTNAGKHIQPYLPFANGIRFTGVPWLNVSVVEFSWNEAVSGIYFATVVIVVLAAAIVVVRRRDV